MKNNNIDEKLGTTTPITYKIIEENGGINKFSHIKSNDGVLLTCEYCEIRFLKIKSYIYTYFKGKIPKTKSFFCSNQCYKNSKGYFLDNVECKNCSKIFKKTRSEVVKTKNNFCSSSCAATYNNKHKTTGTKISKLEIFIQEKLKNDYKDIIFLFNNKTAIESELDIFIPELNLAFELNGIFHYEPIFGDKKMNQILNNDKNKFQKCIEKNISLCIIDTSKQKYFKENTSLEYYKIITDIIGNYHLNKET